MTAVEFIQGAVAELHRATSSGTTAQKGDQKEDNRGKKGLQ